MGHHGHRFAAVTLGLVLLLSVAVVACGGPPDISGAYELTSGSLPLSDVTLTVKADGTFEISGTFSGTDVTVPGSWTQDGDAVTLTPEGTYGAAIGTQSGAYKDGELAFGELVFQKQ